MTEPGFSSEANKPSEETRVSFYPNQEFLAEPKVRRPRLTAKGMPRKNRKKRNPVLAAVIDVIGILFFALMLSLIIKAFVIRAFFIPSGSMESTLEINDRIVVSEFYPQLIPVERGDIIVFKDPGGWLSAEVPIEIPWYTQAWDWVLSSFGITAPDSSQHLVKRVIGIPGDHVVCCTVEGKISINGTPITEPYVKDGSKPSEMNFDVTVPENSYWVMGDNRSNSADSRFHTELPSKGFVGKEFVVGRAFFLTWPFDRFSWLDNYGNVFKNVPKP